jgi:hypothetical protein
MSKEAQRNAASNVISLNPQRKEVTETFSMQQISLTVLIFNSDRKINSKNFLAIYAPRTFENNQTHPKFMNITLTIVLQEVRIKYLLEDIQFSLHNDAVLTRHDKWCCQKLAFVFTSTVEEKLKTQHSQGEVQ